MSTRSKYIAGLRALADLLEQHPDLELPFDGNTLGITVMVHGDQRARLAEWARLLPGRKTKRETGRAGELLKLSGQLRGLKIDVLADREEVCERVVLGTREVIEEVPDPVLLAEVPLVQVPRVEEIVKWRCVPVLAGAVADGA